MITYTTVIHLEKAGSEKCIFTNANDLIAWRSTGQGLVGNISPGKITAKEWNFTIGDSSLLFDKLQKMPLKLGDYTSRIFQGLKTSADKVYILEKKTSDSNKVIVYSRETEKEYCLEADLLHPLAKGGDSKPYSLTRPKRLILFPYHIVENRNASLISPSKMQAQYPQTWAYLIENKTYLEKRENGKMFGESWYQYGRNQALDLISLPKLITPDIALRPSFSLDETGETFFTGGVAGGYGLLISENPIREFILGLLNSRVTKWFIQNFSTQMRGGYNSYEARFIRHIPIPKLNFDDPADKAKHNKMVALVETMLRLHQELPTKTGQEKTIMERQITATDAQIDRLVYDLYGLTEEEIKIVEAAK